MDRHAFIITANGNFTVLHACLRMLDDSRNDIFFLFDRKATVSEENREMIRVCTRQSHVYFLPEKVINWGGYSQIDAVLTLLEAVCEQEEKSGEEYSYIHFLQGSDLPLKKPDEMHAFFERRKGDEFVEIKPNGRGMAENKCMYRHYLADTPSYRCNKVVNALNKAPVLIQKALHIRRNRDIDLYSGSALFSITSDFASYLVVHRDEIHRRFKASLAADEVFIQTMLMASPFKDNAARDGNLRLIDWNLDHIKNSPHIWTKADWPVLMERSEGAMFARKFSEKVDTEVVRMLEEKVSGRS